MLGRVQTAMAWSSTGDS
uniref:Uncharacterized protein n=1 Tax=Arundo donax TaxID=35708 RepID=A0A0A8ZWI0_ARUDO